MVTLLLVRHTLFFSMMHNTISVTLATLICFIMCISIYGSKEQWKGADVSQLFGTFIDMHFDIKDVERNVMA